MFLIQANKIEGKITAIFSSHEERTMQFATSHLSRTIDHLVSLVMNGDSDTEMLVTTRIKRVGNRRTFTRIIKGDELVYTVEVTSI